MPEIIAAQIEQAGGKIEGKLRKMTNGGFVASIDSTTATAAMSKIADWCASWKIRCHLPKPMLRGTVGIIVKNMPIDYEGDDIVEVIRDEGPEAMDSTSSRTSAGHRQARSRQG